MAIDIQATDHFALGANFHAQSSTSPHMEDMANIKDELGNMECETAINGRTEYSTTYRYCNATPDIATDLGDALTAFGDLLNSICPTSLEVSFEAGQYATVVLSGVQYDDNAISVDIGSADVSAAIPASAGFGVPSLPGVTLGTDASPSALSISFSLEHKPAQGSDGNHFTSSNTTFKADANAEYLGVPTTLEPVTGWTTDSYDTPDSNEEHDSAAWTGHRYFDKA